MVTYKEHDNIKEYSAIEPLHFHSFLSVAAIATDLSL